MKTIITEDQAMSIGIEVNDLVKMKCKEGYKVTHTYTHPAVGLVYVLEPDYSLTE